MVGGGSIVLSIFAYKVKIQKKDKNLIKKKHMKDIQKLVII